MYSYPELRFFVVEDDPFSTSVYTQYFENNHYNQVHFFETGSKCLEELHMNPDIIILNPFLEGYFRFDLLREIKRYNSGMYVIMISTEQDVRLAIESIKHGAFDYLLKNNTLCDQISRTIEKIVETKAEISKNMDKS